jgi:hypothetical protein
MLAHARYVLLDAEGLLPHRQQAEDEPEETKPPISLSQETKPVASSGGRWTKIDPPHVVPQPASAQLVTPSPSAISGRSAPVAAAAASPGNHKLTKAERKALKERLLHERRERERSG